jgi:hypothetical protein
MQVLVDSYRIDFARNVRTLQQRLDLAGEDDPLSIVVVIELLHADGVAREDQVPVPPVPEPQRKDSGHLAESSGAKLFEHVEQGLGIGRAAEPDAASFQPAPEPGVVVELAVVGQPAFGSGRCHRLMTGRREIDNRQAAVAEPDGPLDVHSLVVRTSMREHAGHPREQIAIDRSIGVGVVIDAGNAAHMLLLEKSKRAGSRFRSSVFP